MAQAGRVGGVLFLHGFPVAEIVPGLLETNLVEQPGDGSSVPFPGIPVPRQKGGAVLPDAPARFMDVGGAADGADVLGNIGVNGRFKKSLLGRRGVEGHWS